MLPGAVSRRISQQKDIALEIATLIPPKKTVTCEIGPPGMPLRIPPRQEGDPASAHIAHSMTSSARASKVGGTSRPSALAVLRLMANLNLPACRAVCDQCSPLPVGTDRDGRCHTKSSRLR
jgi:hypothetical protein